MTAPSNLPASSVAMSRRSSAGIRRAAADVQPKRSPSDRRIEPRQQRRGGGASGTREQREARFGQRELQRPQRRAGHDNVADIIGAHDEQAARSPPIPYALPCPARAPAELGEGARHRHEAAGLACSGAGGRALDACSLVAGFDGAPPAGPQKNFRSAQDLVAANVLEASIAALERTMPAVPTRLLREVLRPPLGTAGKPLQGRVRRGLTVAAMPGRPEKVDRRGSDGGRKAARTGVRADREIDLGQHRCKLAQASAVPLPCSGTQRVCDRRRLGVALAADDEQSRIVTPRKLAPERNEAPPGPALDRHPCIDDERDERARLRTQARTRSALGPGQVDASVLGPDFAGRDDPVAGKQLEETPPNADIGRRRAPEVGDGVRGPVACDETLDAVVTRIGNDEVVTAGGEHPRDGRAGTADLCGEDPIHVRVGLEQFGAATERQHVVRRAGIRAADGMHGGQRNEQIAKAA